MNTAKWQLPEVESSLQEQQHFKTRFLFIWQRNLFSNTSHLGIWGIQWTTWQTGSIFEFLPRKPHRKVLLPFLAVKEKRLHCSAANALRTQASAVRRRSFTSNWQTESQNLSVPYLAHSLSVLNELKDTTYCRKGYIIEREWLVYLLKDSYVIKGTFKLRRGMGAL